MVTCGRLVEITGGSFAGVNAIDLSWTVTSTEHEITPFGTESEYGVFTSCGRTGEATIGSYDCPDVETGDTDTLVGTVGTKSFTYNVVVTGGPDLTAKSNDGSLATWSTKVRFTE